LPGGTGHHCCVPLCTAGGRFNKMLTQWLIKIRRDGFTVTTRSRVCSRHFETGEIFVSSSGKRCLQPKAVPSLFHWNNFSKKTEQPGVWERRPRPVDTVAMATVDYNTEDENDVSDMPITGCTESAPASIPLIEDHDYAASPLIVLFLFLNYLATGCTQRELCHKFNIHRAIVSRILVSWSNFLYTLLGSVSIWMAPGRVRANCPADFSGTYKKYPGHSGLY
uniref:THAP-type domain-containing protein n=1 Tax=Oreochromis niloticus TaxID=8128 RepID=A0A669EC69_ORENI